MEILAERTRNPVLRQTEERSEHGTAIIIRGMHPYKIEKCWSGIMKKDTRDAH